MAGEGRGQCCICTVAFKRATAAVPSDRPRLRHRDHGRRATAGAFDAQPVDTAALYALNGNRRARSVSNARCNRHRATILARSTFCALGTRPAPNSPRARGERDQTGTRTPIPVRDKTGNPGPTYRVLGRCRAKPRLRRLGQGDQLKRGSPSNCVSLPVPTQSPLLPPCQSRNRPSLCMTPALPLPKPRFPRTAAIDADRHLQRHRKTMVASIQSL